MIWSGMKQAGKANQARELVARQALSIIYKLTVFATAHFSGIPGKGAVAAVTGFWAAWEVPGVPGRWSENCYWRKKASLPQ